MATKTLSVNSASLQLVDKDGDHYLSTDWGRNASLKVSQARLPLRLFLTPRRLLLSAMADAQALVHYSVYVEHHARVFFNSNFA